jgi:pyruvate dehydrogenase E2 component (dihydrolipoamide acetyltransferase)
MPEYLLPDVGEGLTEAEIVTWKVKVGDTIAINDVVVEIETAKSLVELPSPYAGVVGALLVPEGETVAVGTPIIRIGEEAPAAEAAPAADAPASAPARPDLSQMDLSNPAASGGGEGESLVGRNKADRGAQRRVRKGSAAPPSEAVASTHMQVQGAFGRGGAEVADVVEADEEPVPAVPARPVASPAVEPGSPVVEPGSSVVEPGSSVVEPVETRDVRVLAKPPVRKLAKDLGVDLATLTATGPNGSITRADVEGASSVVEEVAQQPSRNHVSSTEGREYREPIKGVRKMMGQAMVQSAFTLPHVTEWVTVDVTPTMELVARLKQHRAFRDVKVSPLLVLARAAMLAMRRTPEINSWWDDAAQEVVFKRYVNLGIAAATPRGLVVPNVKDAESLSLVELAAALNDLTAVAREGKTQPADMSGGTFTITNVGPFGVDAGTPIINPGESAILCFGAVKRQPWVVSTGSTSGGEDTESIEIRDVCTLALAFDHRHVDGEKGSRFLADVAGVMADPATALLF